jgi:phenylacetic acid degradation operon negative regulatory protein
MPKLLRVRDYVLIASAIAGEAVEEVHNMGDIMPKVMEARYGFIPPNYKRNSYLSAVSKMLSTGNIERKVDKKGETYLEITSKGIKRFKRKFPILSLQKKKWDGEFMVVIFDIEEKKRKERDALRIKLRELGFGMLQESVWVSPYHFEEDLREFLTGLELEKYVFVFNAKTLGVGDFPTLVERIWKLTEINSEYAKILKKLDEKKPRLKKVWDEYFSIAINDPMLPPSLLPKDWHRQEVLSKLNKLALTKS